MSDAGDAGEPTAPGAEASGAKAAAIRLDKWLFQARFVKSRGLAAKLVDKPGVRVNGQRAAKPAAMVKPGDVLTFAQGPRIRVIKILAPGTRRGPAPEARALYEDLDPPESRDLPDDAETGETASDPRPAAPPARRERGAGRPTKAERRALDRLRRED